MKRDQCLSGGGPWCSIVAKWVDGCELVGVRCERSAIWFGRVDLNGGCLARGSEPDCVLSQRKTECSRRRVAPLNLTIECDCEDVNQK